MDFCLNCYHLLFFYKSLSVNIDLSLELNFCTTVSMTCGVRAISLWNVRVCAREKWDSVARKMASNATDDRFLCSFFVLGSQEFEGYVLLL